MAGRILIVDDSVSMRQMTSIILKGAGYTVIEAVDGNDGLEKLDSTIDLVITDYNMPNKNGIELIHDIRKGNVNKSVPILILTTESEQSKKEQGKQAGATGWVTKPFDKTSLLQVIKKVTTNLEF